MWASSDQCLNRKVLVRKLLPKQHFWELYQCNFCDLLVNQMLRYKFFPKYIEINHQFESIIQCFYQVEEVINSQKNNFSSNKVLSLLRPYLIQGKRISNPIDTVVLGFTQSTNKFKITTLSQGVGLTFQSLCG